MEAPTLPQPASRTVPPVRLTGPRRLPGWIIVALAVVMMAMMGSLVYQRSFQRGTLSLKEASNRRLDLFASVVESRVRRLEPVPATVGLHPSVVKLLREPQAQHAAAANDYLTRLNAHLGSEAVFVLDVRGVVRASSNPNLEDDSLLGHRIGYRSYFLESLAGRSTRHFAIGAGGQAGYFAAHPIYDGSSVVGVAAIKIGLEALEQTWAMLGVPALVTDANHVVILSSEPPWRYTAMQELSAEQRVDLQLSRTYGTEHVTDFPLQVNLTLDDESQEVQGHITLRRTSDPANTGLVPSAAGYLVLGRTLDGMDWRVLTFTDLSAVRQQALFDAAASAMVVLVLVLLGMYLLQRRRTERQKQEAKRQLEQINADLEQEVARRTQELTDAIARLRREVGERQQTEKNLREAQDELVHAGKMAVLGQLAASITHELTQPLGGIRTLSGNAAEFLRRGNVDAAQENLSIVARLVGQMASIIEPLKGFARKSEARPSATDVGHVVSQALFLFQLRLRHENVQVDNQCTPGSWTAWCDANRLEQVLVNLVANALDAMRDASERRLQITVRPAQLPNRAALSIEVQDSGKGLSDTDLSNLFQPFYTTKPSGAGLGLGLVICRDIAAESGGTLQARNVPGAGACFTLTLPLPP
ncbi:ATP-binding protein [Curvibacter sp. APW13]|uniref:ATP-binding protein n=1 Tax=Curvibacter sp. APW13 TaxID=3077236 RepID=UPI0028DFA81A|nr:ATP-binding protein [Curvibacter sp. APW13]MDT8991075.1 ATP-binding protein [Curvibacter sp. APW13]